MASPCPSLVLALLRGGLGSLAGSALAGAMLSPGAATELREAVRQSVREAPRAGLVRAVRSISLGRGDLVGELPAVRCPALLVAGADDRMYPPERAARECARLPAGRSLIVAAAAHLVPMERPRETAALVRSHLQRVGERRPPTQSAPA